MPGIRIRSRFIGISALLVSAPLCALEIAGASTIQPLVEKLIPLFAAQGGEAVKLAGGGSTVGITSVQAGTSQIGMVSRALTDSEKSTLKHTTIGLDALAIIVNVSNTTAELSKAELIDIFTGKIANWKALGGPDRPVVRISKEVGRSTLELFEHYTGLASPDRKKTDKPLISKQSYIIGSNLESVTLVGSLPGAIGYVSVGTAETMARAGMPIRILRLEKIMPNDETISNKSYPILRELNLAYLRETAAVSAFLATALGSPGQNVVKSLGFLPVSK